MSQIIKTDRAYRTYGDGSRCRRFMVDEDGTVRAWDELARYFTTVHSLTPQQCGRIRAEAAQR
jgi:hypothetical protein